jgi:hypothetical protein
MVLMTKFYIALVLLLVGSSARAEDPSGILNTLLNTPAAWDSEKLAILYDEGIKVGFTEGYNVRLKRYFSNKEKGCASSFLILLSNKILPLYTVKNCKPTMEDNVATAKYHGDVFKEVRAFLVEDAVWAHYTKKISQHFFDIGYQHGFLLQVDSNDYDDFLGSCLSRIEGHIIYYKLSPGKAYDLKLGCRNEAYNYAQGTKSP